MFFMRRHFEWNKKNKTVIHCSQSSLMKTMISLDYHIFFFFLSLSLLAPFTHKKKTRFNAIICTESHAPTTFFDKQPLRCKHWIFDAHSHVIFFFICFNKDFITPFGCNATHVYVSYAFWFRFAQKRKNMNFKCMNEEKYYKTHTCARAPHWFRKKTNNCVFYARAQYEIFKENHKLWALSYEMFSKHHRWMLYMKNRFRLMKTDVRRKHLNFRTDSVHISWCFLLRALIHKRRAIVLITLMANR